jgi:hypothetical protein
MPIETVRVPLSDPLFEIRVIALHKGKDAGPFGYLQAARQGTNEAMGLQLDETAAAANYKAMLFKYKAQLVGAIEGPVDALLSPPSDHACQAMPYRESVAAKFPGAVDLTNGFFRDGTKRAGQGAPLDQVAASLTYKPTGREKEFRRIVIVDDTFTRGMTAAAIITQLRKHGLPENCEVILACPLWLDTVKPVVLREKLGN